MCGWVGRGTLLGPEVSAVGRVLLGLLGGLLSVWGWVVLVGLLFVNWIVDASILRLALGLLGSAVLTAALVSL